MPEFDAEISRFPNAQAIGAISSKQLYSIFFQLVVIFFCLLPIIFYKATICRAIMQNQPSRHAHAGWHLSVFTATNTGSWMPACAGMTAATLSSGFYNRIFS
jgi:hypothetical protein